MYISKPPCATPSDRRVPFFFFFFGSEQRGKLLRVVDWVGSGLVCVFAHGRENFFVFNVWFTHSPQSARTRERVGGREGGKEGGRKTQRGRERALPLSLCRSLSVSLSLCLFSFFPLSLFAFHSPLVRPRERERERKEKKRKRESVHACAREKGRHTHTLT